jgi:hypothetical protein
MNLVFNDIMNTQIIPFFKANGFETKDINSDTNKTLGLESYYFYKADEDLNRNFYFETNLENTAEKCAFTFVFGIYSSQFSKTIGFPLNDAPSGLGNTFSLSSEPLSENGAYWQVITPKTDTNAFSKKLLEHLKTTIDEHQAITNVSEMINYFFKKDNAYHDYGYMIRYLKTSEQQAILDEYVAKLRIKHADTEYILKDIERLLDTTILKQKVINNFPEGIKLPKSWEKVLDWAEKNIGKVIGGHFEIIENSNNMLQHLVNINGKAAKYLAVIGENGASEIFCLWQKDNKNAPIVLLGEAGAARIVAENIDDFIQLLAVGYYEIEVADYDAEPVFPEGADHWKNPEFQAFYKKKFKQEIPKTGTGIAARITSKDAVFFDWMCENDELWKQWKH